MKLPFSLYSLILVSANALTQNVDLLGYLQYPARLSDIWGYEDTLGNEYALVGVLNGTSIVDISTNPSQPTELFFVPGPVSIWRDIKTWNQRAYVTNETGEGLLIIDLSDLPNSISTTTYTTDPLSVDTFRRAHNIFIDENGFAYLLGSNAGTYIVDLKPDPDAPRYAGKYELHYVHDAFVKGDTMWTAEIYDGQLAAVDVSNKANPVVIGTVSTPFHATHNVWLSDDGKYAFTTDERSGAPVTSFDVNDVTDMFELDRFFSHPGSGVIPHNTFWLNGFLITANYKDGVVITDAHRPQNLIKTGGYDTSPFPSSDGFNGCWGVYPFFTSGKIIAADIEEGLFVLQPTYRRASYLEGQVTDAITSVRVSNVTVELINMEITDLTDIIGTYRTGILDSGLFDVRFSRPGCSTVIAQNVLLEPGQVTTLDVQMNCWNLGIQSLHSQDQIWFDNSTSRISWRLGGAAIPGELAVMAVDGRLIRKKSISSSEGSIELRPDLAGGIYMAVLKSRSEVIPLKFMVN